MEQKKTSARQGKQEEEGKKMMEESLCDVNMHVMHVELEVHKIDRTMGRNKWTMQNEMRMRK